MTQPRSLLLALLIFSFAACNSNHAKIDNDLKTYFDSSKVDGCFALLNNQMSSITVYNMKLDTQRVAAGTSAKIPITLIGIQTGKVINENSRLSGDTATPDNPTLKEAFQHPSADYFRLLADSIGKDTLKFWLDSLGYGNKNFGPSPDSIFENNLLTISPDEQLGMLSKLYFEQLPFQKYAQEIVENLMLQQQDSLFKLSATSGAAIEKDARYGWYLGWIEENRHIYFFVTLVKTGDPAIDLNTTPAKISGSILRHLGFFKGEK